jgi:hypothetical protein
MTIGVPDPALTVDKRMNFTWDQREEYAPNAAADLTAAGSLLSTEGR